MTSLPSSSPQSLHHATAEACCLAPRNLPQLPFRPIKSRCVIRYPSGVNANRFSLLLEKAGAGDPFSSQVLRGCSSRLLGVRNLGWKRKAVDKRAVMGTKFSASAHAPSEGDSNPTKGRVCFSNISDEEWQGRLTKEQYIITRKKGTERAFTGEYWNTKTPGVYHCVCCDTPLFESKTKFDSGTGWPSYYEPIENNVKSEMDWSIIFMPRTEVLCANCNAHLGHVFNDGPPPTGKRYCINSASLVLNPS